MFYSFFSQDTNFINHKYNDVTYPSNRSKVLFLKFDIYLFNIRVQHTYVIYNIYYNNTIFKVLITTLVYVELYTQ